MHSSNEENQPIIDAVQKFVTGLTSREKEMTHEYWNAGGRGVLEALDRRLLAHCRDFLGRNLDPEEMKYMRAHFRLILANKPSD